MDRERPNRIEPGDPIGGVRGSMSALGLLLPFYVVALIWLLA